jgi:subtilisin family serine protease
LMKRFNILLLSMAMAAIWVTPVSAAVSSHPEAFGLPTGVAPISKATNLASALPTDNVLVTYPNLAARAASLIKSETPLVDGSRTSVSIMTKADAQAFAKKNPNVVIETDKPIFQHEVNTSPSWNQDRIDQQSLPLDGIYRYQTTGKGVRVYVIDSGVRASNPEFGNRVESGYYSSNVAYSSDDCSGHGTSVASLIAGKTLGVAPEATIIPLRVFSCSGSGYQSYSIEALNWVIANHPYGVPGVINMSLGGAYSPAYNTAVQTAIDRGFSVVASAGNESSDACYSSPASAPGAITVGASDRNDRVSTFSNYGSCVDIFAPGSDLQAANMSGLFPRSFSGTSASAPVVTGVIARFLERKPTLSPSEVSELLKSTATGGVLAGLVGSSPNRLIYISESGLAFSPVPTISGEAAVGETLTTVTGPWDEGTSFSYQWLRNGVLIPNETKAVLVLTEFDLGTQISVTLTGINAGSTAIRTSRPTVPVKKGNLNLGSAPLLLGQAIVGSTLKVDTSAFPSNLSLTYTWFVDGQVAASIGASEFPLTAALLGKKISVKVQASRQAYNSSEWLIASAGPVSQGIFKIKTTPVLQGELRADSNLEVIAGNWDDGVIFNYAWFIDGVSVDNESEAKFVIPRDAIGKQVSVTVTVTKPGYKSESFTFTPEIVAPLQFSSALSVVITGKTNVGKLLSAKIQSLESGTRFTYQWRRNGLPIKGATKASYVLTTVDLSKMVSVEVIVSNKYFETIKLVSKATKKVTK